MDECYQGTRERCFKEMCPACNEEFWRWFIPHPGGADSNDLIAFIAKRLKGLAHRIELKQTILRCECFNSTGRCRNFGNYDMDGRHVCQFHVDRIAKGWTPVFTKRHLTNWREKVTELIYGDWADE